MRQYPTSPSSFDQMHFFLLLVIAVFGIGCAQSPIRANRAGAHEPEQNTSELGAAEVSRAVAPAIAEPATATPNNVPERVVFEGAFGILACSWLDGTEIVAEGVSEVIPELTTCAAQAGYGPASAVVWTEIAGDGVVVRAWALPDDPNPPPPCVLDIVHGLRFSQGPPSCGNVNALSFTFPAAG